MGGMGEEGYESRDRRGGVGRGDGADISGGPTVLIDGCCLYWTGHILPCK